MDINRKEQDHPKNQGIVNDVLSSADEIAGSEEMPDTESGLNKELTSSSHRRIMTPKETAQFLGKSLSWVYKNASLLGGRKLGGSLFFPAKEDLYEHLFGKGKGVEVRLHSGGGPDTPKDGSNENETPSRQKWKGRRS